MEKMCYEVWLQFCEIILRIKWKDTNASYGYIKFIYHKSFMIYYEQLLSCKLIHSGNSLKCCFETINYVGYIRMATIYLSNLVKGTAGIQRYLCIRILCSRKGKTTLMGSVLKFNIDS